MEDQKNTKYSRNLGVVPQKERKAFEVCFFFNFKKKLHFGFFYGPPKMRNVKYQKIITSLLFNFFDCGFHFSTP